MFRLFILVPALLGIFFNTTPLSAMLSRSILRSAEHLTPFLRQAPTTRVLRLTPATAPMSAITTGQQTDGFFKPTSPPPAINTNHLPTPTNSLPIPTNLVTVAKDFLQNNPQALTPAPTQALTSAPTPPLFEAVSDSGSLNKLLGIPKQKAGSLLDQDTDLALNQLFSNKAEVGYLPGEEVLNFDMLESARTSSTNLTQNAQLQLPKTFHDLPGIQITKSLPWTKILWSADMLRRESNNIGLSRAALRVAAHHAVQYATNGIVDKAFTYALSTTLATNSIGFPVLTALKIGKWAYQNPEYVYMAGQTLNTSLGFLTGILGNPIVGIFTGGAAPFLATITNMGIACVNSTLVHMSQGIMRINASIIETPVLWGINCVQKMHLNTPAPQQDTLNIA